MRRTCLNMVYEMAKKDGRIVFIGSDLGFGTLDEFKEQMPERFFMEGIAEANVVGMAAGMAMEGGICYANTIAPFFTRRAYEQVCLDMCLHNVNVRLIGNGGGVVYAPLGPTHLAIEDIAAMRALPNMTILAPADAEEMKRLMTATVDHQGPIYIRLAKGGDDIVTQGMGPFEIGKAYPAREGEDALVITTGVGLQVCLEGAGQLAAVGLEVGVLHMPTIKPLDSRAVLERAKDAPAVVTVEEHVIGGGLGSAVAELLSEACLERPLRFKRLGLPDSFPGHYGSQKDVMATAGITPENLAATVMKLLRH